MALHAHKIRLLLFCNKWIYDIILMLFYYDMILLLFYYDMIFFSIFGDITRYLFCAATAQIVLIVSCIHAWNSCKRFIEIYVGLLCTHIFISISLIFFLLQWVDRGEGSSNPLREEDGILESFLFVVCCHPFGLTTWKHYKIIQ